MDWSDTWRGAFRIELRAEALGFASRGWPVLPGIASADSASGFVPIHADWATKVANCTPDEVATWWNDSEVELLVATGQVLDAIEVSAALGRSVAAVLRVIGIPAPILATPDGKWLFLVRPGTDLRPELTGRVDVCRYGTGHHIPLPPSAVHEGIVHWRVKPEVCGWQLPRSQDIQEVLVSVLDSPVTEHQELVVLNN